MTFSNEEIELLRSASNIIAAERMRLNTAIGELSNANVRVSEALRELQRAYASLCQIIEKTLLLEKKVLPRKDDATD